MKSIHKSKKSRIKGVLLVSASLFLVNPVSRIWAQEATEASLVNQLMIKLQERDQVITDLQRRVQQLEQRVGAGQQSSESATAAKSAAVPPSKATTDQPAGTEQQSSQSALAAQPPAAPSTQATSDQPVRQTQADEAATKIPPATVAQSKKGPGGFEVDEEAAERALERTLVQTGALLLPFGQAEIQPFVNYARLENEQPILLRDPAGNIAAATNIQSRQNNIEAGVFFRLGLPFETQAELSIPTRVINQSTVVANQETENTTHMLGDIRVGLAKTLLRETGWLPDIIGRVTWDTDTSKQIRNNTSAEGLPTSFNDLIFSVTALKRQDPLAFTSTVSYRTSFKKDHVEPGDVYSLALGATLAASPQTSLSLGLQQNFIDHTKLFGNSIPGSDAISSIFTLGASSILAGRLFFSTIAGIGLTKSAPDYFVSVAVPLRFDVPFNQMFRSN
ncbi:hypothetical protein [Nitrosomonas sp. Nm34]|uniref:hypothetical protein n=1 Tax=Nitrosomonas sp. Nm34 TaxID=1881055 RepID=UPI0011143903|nr:hypothetical protein [Nitrosomonas sp. Nm34]